MDTNKPQVIKSHDVQLDAEYAQWIAELKFRYRSAQVKAAVRVNGEKLLFNWQLGRDLVQKKAEERWGSGVVEQVSLDMRQEFPDAEGFSVRNLRYMKQWYLYYSSVDAEILQRLVAEMGSSSNRILQRAVAELQEADNKSDIKLAQVGREFVKRPVSEFPLPFALVPWGQHIEIISHCKTVEEALFYMRETIENGLTRPALVNCIKANLYEHKGKILNNFSEQLPALQSKLVQEILKENYDFGFATVSHQLYDEHELEEALSQSITSLLLELGTGFAFMGRQKEIIVGGRSRKIDLLFYHIRLRCYIVCELKAREFEPEYAGKLNFYVNAVDDLLKADDDNPTIGLLICSNMNKADVQWSFRGISTPMGVATYNNIRIKDMLPTQEQLRERMELLQKELRETQRLMGKTE